MPVAPGTHYGEFNSDPVPVPASEVSLVIPTTTTHVEPPAAPATVMPHGLPPSHEDGLDALAPTCEKDAALLPPSAVSLAPEVPETGGATVLSSDASVAPATDVPDASAASAHMRRPTTPRPRLRWRLRIAASGRRAEFDRSPCAAPRKWCLRESATTCCHALPRLRRGFLRSRRWSVTSGWARRVAGAQEGGGGYYRRVRGTVTHTTCHR